MPPKKKALTVKQQWFVDNRERVAGEEGLGLRAIGVNKRLEVLWTAERKRRAAVGGAAVAPPPPGVVAPPAVDGPGEDGERPKKRVRKGKGKGKAVEAIDHTEAVGGGDTQKEPAKFGSSLGSGLIPVGERLGSSKVKAMLEKEGLANVPRQPTGSRWQAGRLLGAGSFGSAYIWFELDRNGLVTKRVVVKDCYVWAGSWGEIHHWHGDPRNPVTRKHVEIAAMELVRDRPGSENLVDLVASDTDDARRWYRIYMGFCPYGDLGGIVKYYKAPEYIMDAQPIGKECKDCHQEVYPKSMKCSTCQLQLKPKPKLAPEAQSKRDKWKLVRARMWPSTAPEYRPIKGKKEPFIPEPFIWWVFSSLTDACLVLETGGVEVADAVEKWEVIVHRDIKPDNIYLDAPGETFPAYPRARIGDFGISLITSENDVLNPDAYADNAGTRHWRAPEQCSMTDPKTGRPGAVGQLLSHTNVWAIGLLILGLINRTDVPTGTNWLTGDRKPAVDPIPKELYSQELQNLVMRCVEFQPEERISLRPLREGIRYHTGVGPEDDDEATDELPGLLRRLRSNKHRADEPDFDLIVQDELYKLGLTPDAGAVKKLKGKAYPTWSAK